MTTRPCSCVAFMLAYTLLAVDRAPAEDKVVGRIWEIKWEAKDPKKAETRRFRATPDFKVWNMPEQGTPKVIGKWSGNEEKTTMNLTVPGDKSGKYEVVLIGRNPDRWQGTFESENGKRRPVKIRLVRD